MIWRQGRRAAGDRYYRTVGHGQNGPFRDIADGNAQGLGAVRVREGGLDIQGNRRILVPVRVRGLKGRCVGDGLHGDVRGSGRHGGLPSGFHRGCRDAKGNRAAEIFRRREGQAGKVRWRQRPGAVAIVGAAGQLRPFRHAGDNDGKRFVAVRIRQGNAEVE